MVVVVQKYAAIISALAGIVSAVAAIGAVWVAYFSLDRAALQLKGTTLYNVAKDGKALQRRYEKGDAIPGEVMSYLFSVFTLRAAQVLDERDWKPFESAICSFIKSGPNVQRDWDEHKESYDAEFRALVERLKGSSKC